MNLSEVFDAALPELPKARLTRTRPPCLDPGLVAREDTLDGEDIVAVIQRSTDQFYRFSPAQWQLVLFFDGVRSYEEIAAAFNAQTGASLKPGDVREFAESMEQCGFWYKTPQEKNLAYSLKLSAGRERRARRKSKLNFTHMNFSGWDPDRFLTWLDAAVGRFVFSPWCILAMVLLFAYEASVFVGHWSTIGPDAKLYYDFTQKSLLDLAGFWLLFLAIGFIHESAHGLTCKHYGGEVHAMGLMFIYMMPAFYVDTTEMWTSASKLQRLATIIAGIWIEMVVCGIAMIVWLNTAVGGWLHDFAYQLILITGIAVILINLNPLIKLDGYYLLTNAISIPDLKERSTGFLAGWFQRTVLRLNVDMPVVPRRRAPFFILYALLSGAYSYMILFFVIRFAYNVTSHWLSEFALIPSGAMAFAIFRGRLRSIRDVTLQTWRQNLGSDRRLRPSHLGAVVLVAAVLFVPFSRDRENGYFVIEPLHSQILHAALAGQVTDVLAHEGQQVRAGQPLLTIASPLAASMTESAMAETHAANFQAFDAELQRRSIGPASAQQAASRRYAQLAQDAQSSLTIAAPEDGIMLSENPGALIGQHVASGQGLLDVAEGAQRAVRVYVPATALQRIPAGATVALKLPGSFSTVHLTLAQIGGETVSLPGGLVPSQNYKGVRLPDFYVARMPLPLNAGKPGFGVAGPAKIFGIRRSFAARIFTSGVDLVKAHVW
ncbi:MAG TPA: HlyD family efflux transporter periplasmic adaptor subunit [Terracidiphilus sp.]|jgi:putative peptide zinc metalloprotease protein